MCKRSRREFLKRACLTAAGTPLVMLPSMAACSPDLPPGEPSPTVKAKKKPRLLGRVVSLTDHKVFGTHGPQEARVKRLVQRSLAKLFDVKDYREAYRELFSPKDIVAIKLNCLAGPGLSSSPSVVDALVAGLKAIGVEPRNIYIWERTSQELQEAGFAINRYADNRPRCLGNDEAGFARNIEFSGEIGSLFTNILARRATALINVPVLKDHDLSGVGCGMKNMYGAIHNPNRYHENNCDPYVADVSNHPFVKDKLKLVVADAMTAQYQGGPAKVVSHQWRESRIMAATDPVAMDRIAQKILEEKRAQKGMASFEEGKRSPRWIKTAAKYGLGEASLKNIKIIES
jgi:uncharacterized protein (DUF362 family)